MKFQYDAMGDIPGFVLASGDCIARCEAGAPTFDAGQQRAVHTSD
jgi:hypothetical protein